MEITQDEQKIQEAVKRQVDIWAEVVGNMKKGTENEILFMVYRETNNDLRYRRKSGSNPATAPQIGLVVQLNGDVDKVKKMNTKEASDYIEQLKKEKSNK